MEQIEQAFDATLRQGIERGASDIHISAGYPFRLRIHGKIENVAGCEPLKPSDTWTIATKILIAGKRATPETIQEKLQRVIDIIANKVFRHK